MIKIIAAVTLTTLMLTGCNTTKGLGEDVSGAGHAVTGTAQAAQDKM